MRLKKYVRLQRKKGIHKFSVLATSTEIIITPEIEDREIALKSQLRIKGWFGFVE